MTAEERLSILKSDIQMLTNANDLFLKRLLEQAEEAVNTEGIQEEDTVTYDMVIIQYAAYLFRKRASSDTVMPRFLRYQMNNLIFKQKGKTT